jgi:GNAT superfamily N-acetyltransferase
MPDWTIRDAAPVEAPELAALQRRAAAVHESDRALLEAEPGLIQPPHRAIAEGRLRVAVDPSGRILGFCSVAPRAAGIIEVDDLFVDPSVMRQGVGRALLGDAIRRAAACGARAIEVTVNPNVTDFYGRLGFLAAGGARTRFGPAPRMRLEIGPRAAGARASPSERCRD